MGRGAKKKYTEDLLGRYWAYQKTLFPAMEKYFDRLTATDNRPPVFTKDMAQNNLLVNPDASTEETRRFAALVPPGERHIYFGSMNSSQALAQSVLGNLSVYGELHNLNNLTDEFGNSLFDDVNVEYEYFHMEHNVKHLKERRSTSLDGYISGPYQIAIECKFTEAEIGTCSRPNLKKKASNYATDYCNGNYTYQLSRDKRCTHTKNDALYWQYVPELFNWDSGIDHLPCPLNKNYQLVRNILAACVLPDGSVSNKNGHVVLIYDARNPAFQIGGAGDSSFHEVREGLKNKNLLRRISWQRIAAYMRDFSILPWLTEQLDKKYGL